MKRSLLGRRWNRITPRLTHLEQRIAPAAIDLTPVAKFDRASVSRGQSVTVNVLANDVDPEGAIPPTSITITQQPTNGTLTVNPDGTVVFKHDGKDMPFDSFRYTIRDQAGQVSREAIALIDIKSVANVAPTAVNDTTSLAKGESKIISVLSNDTDSDGSLDNTSIVITQQPSNGTVTVNANGTITYLHNGSSTVTTDTLKYTVRDNQGLVSSPATVSITITSSTPVAVNDSATVVQASTVTFNVANNDVAPTGGTLNLQSIVITQQPANGTIANLNNGQLTYSHNGNASTTDTFKYTIKSASGVTSNEAIVTLTITPNSENVAPVAVNDQSQVARGGTVVIPVTANDSDSDGTLNLTTIEFPVRPTNGTVTANADGTVTFKHNGAANSVDTFIYTIRDNRGKVSNSATVAINIVEANQNPVAGDDSATVIAGASVEINLAANDSDPENQLNLNSIVIVDQPDVGTLSMNANGKIVYKHNGGAIKTDSFTYKISDLQGAVSDEATVNITITENNAPTAENDASFVASGGSVIVSVAANDTDPENQLDLNSIAIVDQPDQGTVTINANGTITYNANDTATSTDSFSYTIRDQQGNISNAATVTITISEDNEVPLANNDTAVVNMGQNVTINVASNDSDAEDQLDLTSISISSSPTNGTVVVNADGTVKYTHNNNSAKTDIFRYTIRDAQGAISNEAQVSITINEVAQAPVAKNDTGSVASGKSVTVAVLLNDSDPNNNIDPTKVTITGQPDHGSVSVTANGSIVYTHDGTTAGAIDTFRYRVADTTGLESNIATVTISIIDDIDGPTPQFTPQLPVGPVAGEEMELSEEETTAEWAALSSGADNRDSIYSFDPLFDTDGQEFTSFRDSFSVVMA